MRATFLTLMALLGAAASAPGQLNLVPRGSIWKYYASGPVEAEWAQSAFDDRTWPSARAQLGYGDGDEQTVLFDDAGDAPATLYFRRAFTVTNWSTITSVTLRVLADDGVVVYLNGREVLRRNLPAGPVTDGTPAVVNVETDESRFVQFGMSRSDLRTNANVIAAEVHQHPAGLHDASFDLELLANLPIGSPTIRITHPAHGAVLGTGPILMTPATSDPAGHVTRVWYFTNAVFLGQATNEPFSFNWVAPAPGRHTVNAWAFNNANRYGLSPPVQVQVGEVARNRLSRAPYVQCGSPTGMVVRWQTDWFCDAVLRYGASVNALDQAMTNTAISTEHEMKIGGLTADTVYYYAVGTRAETLAGGSGFHFRTSPTNARPVRIWVVGDSGSADQNAADVRDAYYADTGSGHTDVVLMLGDNSYGNGFDVDYTKAVFDTYRDLLQRSVVWPALGNHDAGDSFTDGAAAYFNSFAMPQQGEAGGLASGTKLYYSFDYANVHLIALDSFLSDRSTNGAMLTWLRNDLAATDKDWIICYWHHPPYSWGGHDSDTEYFQIEMRERVLPILEAYGVDLVLAGHSHVYERSMLLDGHYGYSSSLQPAMVLDAGRGRRDVEGPYRKPAAGLGARGGTVYVVCGCSGAGGGGDDFPRHPVMAVNRGGYGSMVIEVSGLQLTTRFLRPSAAVDDYFAIDKSAPTTVGPRMQITRGTNGAAISWPTSQPAFTLQAADALPPLHWAASAEPVTTTGRQKVVTIETNGASRFFRLRAAP